ncbi:hypothetical protein ACS0TY_017444 [Phlomoides rotata]
MELKQSLLHLFLFFLVLGIASSSYISNEVFEPHGTTGRSLLQQKTSCSVDLANMNYTVITSQCKGPNYSRDRCCTPLKQMLCPIKDQINDLKSDCADVFFSYVNLYGKYPPGLFAALCREDAQGLDCANVPPLPQGNANANGAYRLAGGYSPIPIILAGVVFMLLYI